MADHSTSCQPGYPFSFLFLEVAWEGRPGTYDDRRFSLVHRPNGPCVSTYHHGWQYCSDAGDSFWRCQTLASRLVGCSTESTMHLAISRGSRQSIDFTTLLGFEEGRWVEWGVVGRDFFLESFNSISFQKDDLNIFFVDICYGNRPPRCQ